MASVNGAISFSVANHVMPKVISLVTLKLTGLISLCGCLTLRVGNHKMKPDKKKIEEFKKEFQTSNYSANEYMKWRRSGIIGTNMVTWPFHTSK